MIPLFLISLHNFWQASGVKIDVFIYISTPLIKLHKNLYCFVIGVLPPSNAIAGVNGGYSRNNLTNYREYLMKNLNDLSPGRKNI